ncbi:tumor necrosis factor receptor superfamily member 16 [Hoplias malabaricus]|uniref:tumor necrosis factor receptor superfamily member 16 n=1 Tax=Hoplias malabaricus TaxID=27720 RepID=UPI003462BB72
MEMLRICFCLLGIKVVLGDVCLSMQFTHHGECCNLCQAGFGVVSECGAENTKCKPCKEGVTFSSSEGSSACQVCSRCPAGVPQVVPCSTTEDTRCDCGKGFYLWREGNSSVARCAACRVCEIGAGVTRQCGTTGNTQCQPCSPGTFSEERSNTQPCQPCSRCRENQEEIRPCQLNSDTLCLDKELHIASRPAGSEIPIPVPHWPVVTENENVKTSGSPGSAAPELTPQDQGGNNILLYVSLLAAVVLGLLLYVAYKCWKSFQQKKALGKARVAELGNITEAEKLHSDSGVFLDNVEHVQDTQLSKGSKRDSRQDLRLYINLPPHQQQEVEQMLEEGSGQSWRQLGGALGYESERLDTFGRGQDPVHTLLSDWSQQDGSTLGQLSSALARIDRNDISRLFSVQKDSASPRDSAV